MTEDDLDYNEVEKRVSDLYEAQAQDLYDYGMKFTGQSDLIKDCLHDLFVSIWQKRDTLEIRNTRAYLFKSLSRNILNKIQRNRLRDENVKAFARLEVYPFEIPLESNIIHSEEREELSTKINSAIHNLSPRQKEVIFLRYHINMPNDDISEVMCIDINSVYKLHSSAIKRLKVIFNKKNEQGLWHT